MQLFSTIKDEGVRFGLLAGLFTVAYFGAFYLIDKEWMLSPYVYYGSLAIYFWAMYQSLKQASVRKQELLSWREALRNGFVVFLIANAFFLLFFVVINKMDPSLQEIQRVYLKEWYPRIFPKDQLALRLRELEKADLSMSVSKAVFSYARAAIGGFIVSALLAVIHRRDYIKF